MIRQPQKPLAQIAYEVKWTNAEVLAWNDAPRRIKTCYERIARAVEREVLRRARKAKR